MWIPSKITRPRPFSQIINRSRLLVPLATADQFKLVLLRAPAGYGKTTMAVQWLADKPNVGWFNIDNTDNDEFRFANYFLQALNHATNGQCSNSLKLAQSRQYSSLQALFADLLGELSKINQRYYLVLDDYHLIDNDALHQAIRFLIKHQPDKMTLVMTSRSIPAIGTANLRVRNQLLEIDISQLAFDSDEIARFFHQSTATRMHAETANRLCSYTEGWASALQLMALQASQATHSIESIATDLGKLAQPHLWEYLIEEVFDLLSQELQQFLLHCSVLDHFNDLMAIQLSQRDDALAMIETLVKCGLFISPLEGDGNWYCFHPLFAEFLWHQRETLIPQQEQRLQTGAAHAWLAQSSPHQALIHAKRANNTPLISDILLEHGWKMFNQGELDTLNIAINALDNDHIFHYPPLCLLKAWLAQSQHQTELVSEIIETSIIEMKRRNVDINSKLQGEFDALRAQVAINQNQPEQANVYAESALSLLDHSSYRSRIVATSVIGEVNHVSGQLDRALSLMQQTEKLARQYQVSHQTLWALLQQSEILMAQGMAQSAYDLQETAFKLVETHNLHQLPLYEFLLRIRAQLLWCWNRLEEAEQFALRGLDVIRHLDESKHLHSYSILAQIALSRGQQEKTAHYVQKIEQLLNRGGYHLDWRASAYLSQLLYWQANDDKQAINDWLLTTSKPHQACNHFTQLQWRNIARAQIHLEDYTEAKISLDRLNQQASAHSLLADSNRNLVLEAVLAIKQADHPLAQKKLSQALQLTNQTGMLGNFLIDGPVIHHQLSILVKDGSLNELDRYRLQSVLKSLAIKSNEQRIEFDDTLFNRLIAHPQVPELIRTSPLTQREWQVLGLIYSGCSNEQIALELDVAATTIKTHIRNLYQKLNISDRSDAKATAKTLLELIGYS
jgi:LuxR family maltose regulon positive regulatory protein